MSIMSKLNLFTAILATSFSVGVVKDTTLNATNFSEFTQLSNGDYSLGGRFGSITDELASYDIDILDYQMGFYGDSTLMAAPDDENNFYIYIYESEGFQVDYDKVSIGYYEGELSSWDYSNLTYLEFDLTLVAFDETGHIFKYHIDSFTVSSNTDYVVLVRQIYQYSNRESIEFIRGVGLIYQFDYESQKSKCTTEETVVVTDKLVGYSWYSWFDSERTADDYVAGWNGSNSAEGAVQRNWVAFSTDYEIEDLQSVRLKYDGYTYASEVNVDFSASYSYWGTDATQYGFYSYLQNKDLINYTNKNSLTILEEFNDLDKTITPETYSFSYDLSSMWSSLWFWTWDNETESHSYDLIARTSTLSAEKDGIIDTSIYDYDWVVTFDNRFVYCAFIGQGDTFGGSSVSDLYVGAEVLYGYLNYETNEFDTCEIIGNRDLFSYFHHSFYDVLTLWNDNSYITGNNYFNDTFLYSEDPFTSPYCDTDDHQVYWSQFLTYADSVNAPLQVEDLTILELTWKEDGEIKFAIAVDGYTNSSGGIQFDQQTSTSTTIGEQIAEWFNDIVDTIGEWIEDIIPDWVVWILYGLIVIVILWVVFKVLGLIISLFKK